MFTPPSNVARAAWRPPAPAPLPPSRALFVCVRRELLKHPKVRFAGYKHPHPLENDILIKVQTAPGYQPTAALSESAKKLEDTFTVLLDQFRVQAAKIRAEEGEIGGQAQMP